LVVVDLVQHYAKNGFPPPLLLNINVPDIPFEALQGRSITRLGKRHKAEPVFKATTPRGETVYWVGAAGAAQDAGHDTDFFVVEHQKVSMTPLQVDLTQYKQLDDLKHWLER
jgi:5'-nucleotidase